MAAVPIGTIDTRDLHERLDALEEGQRQVLETLRALVEEARKGASAGNA